MEISENRLLKKLKGYQKAPRARFMLLLDKRLTQEEFLMFELGVAIADWDSSHTETFGTFTATNQQLAELLVWKSDTTALRCKKSLIKKGFFIEVGNGRISPIGFERWLVRRINSSEIETNTAKQQSLSANLEVESAKREENSIQNINYPLVSFKDHLSLSQIDESLSDRELDEIITSIDSQKITSFSSPKNFLNEWDKLSGGGNVN